MEYGKSSVELTGHDQKLDFEDLLCCHVQEWKAKLCKGVVEHLSFWASHLSDEWTATHTYLAVAKPALSSCLQHDVGCIDLFQNPIKYSLDVLIQATSIHRHIRTYVHTKCEKYCNDSRASKVRDSVNCTILKFPAPVGPETQSHATKTTCPMDTICSQMWMLAKSVIGSLYSQLARRHTGLKTYALFDIRFSSHRRAKYKISLDKIYLRTFYNVRFRGNEPSPGPIFIHTRLLHDIVPRRTRSCLQPKR